MKSILLIASYISYMGTYLVRMNLSVAAPYIRDLGMLTNAQIGTLGSIFTAGYATGRILNGMLCDRVKPRYLMAAGLILAGVCNIGVSALPPFWSICVLWAVNALALSMLWGAVQSTMFAVYDTDEAKRKSAVIGRAVCSGNVAGLLLAMFLSARLGPQMAFAIPGALVAILGAADYFLFRNVGLYYETAAAEPAQPEAYAETAAAKESKPVQFCEAAEAEAGKSARSGETAQTAEAECAATGVRAILSLLSRPQVRKVCACAMAHGIIKENINIWLALIFIDLYAVDLKSKGFFIVLVPVVGFVGRRFFPAIYRACGDDELRASRFALIFCILASVVLCFRRFGFVTALITICLMYAAISVINTALLGIYPGRFAGEHHLNTLAGLMDTMTYMSCAVSSVIYGYTVDRFGYLPMFLSWAVMALLGTMALSRIDTDGGADSSAAAE